MCKGSVALHCGGQELQDGFSKKNYEQFVAVDDVRHTVSDGLYFKCTPPLPPPPPPPPICLVYYKKKRKKKKGEKRKEKKGKKEKKDLPICLSSNVSIV